MQRSVAPTCEEAHFEFVQQSVVHILERLAAIENRLAVLERSQGSPAPAVTVPLGQGFTPMLIEPPAPFSLLFSNSNSHIILAPTENNPRQQRPSSAPGRWTTDAQPRRINPTERLYDIR
jgi:hypothetical protein